MQNYHDKLLKAGIIPDDYRIFNRIKKDGTRRPISEFFDEFSEVVKQENVQNAKR